MTFTKGQNVEIIPGTPYCSHFEGCEMTVIEHRPETARRYSMVAVKVNGGYYTNRTINFEPAVLRAAE
jgi:hypothetical protein